MKVAYLCEPQFGGTFTFFRRLRPRLAALGVDFRCVPPYSVETFRNSPFEGEEGVDFLELPLDLSVREGLVEASRILIGHLVKERFDAALILPGCDILTTNLARYLPRSIRCAARVSLMARGAYAPTRAVAEHLNKVFAVSHRVAGDLEQRYGIPGDVLRVVYNGAEIRPFRERAPVAGRLLRLLYAGRLSDVDKGALQLPDILRRVRAAGADVRLTVAGAGPDADRLRDGFRQAGVEDRVTLLGARPLGEVERLLDESDVFLLTSRLEGCPNALVEAMAAGCVPVAFRIRDSVDRIVENGISGLLAAPGDTEAFARAILRLAGEPELCRSMRTAARRRVEAQFSAEQTAAGYAEVFRDMAATEDRRPAALPLSRYRIPRALKPTWRTRVPVPLKNLARKWLERFGISA